VFDAVLRLVEWAAAGRPVLLVAEDVHRADRASLALSAHIGRRLAALSVLFVLTRRDRPAHVDADALLADLGSRGVEVTEIELTPLPDGAVAEVVRAVAALPAAAVDRVVAVADGKPAARGGERPRGGGGRRAGRGPRRRSGPSPAAGGPRGPRRAPLAQAARHARALGALPEATAFWAEAVRCDPNDGATLLELAEVHAWSGRTAEFEREWAAALAALAPADAADAWRRRGLLLKTVVCNPAASLAAYRRAAELLAPDAPATLRAQVLVGLAWNEGATGDPNLAEVLLAQVRVLVAAGGHAAGTVGAVAPDEIVAETESARLITLIRLGRFAECEAVAGVAGAAADRLRRPDLA
jgi:hypothetical protein